MADNLTQDQKNKIDAFKVAYADAQKHGDQAGMDAAHKGAEDIRAQSGYSGGADGSQYIPMEPKPDALGVRPTPRQPNQSALGVQDRQWMSTVDQDKINALKAQYAQAQAAGDKAAMELAHQQAEAIRKGYGYSGNVDGNGGNGTNTPFGSNPLGGMTAEEMAQWAEDYDRSNQRYYGPKGHNVYSNGYSTAMNLRSMANKIRQQMYANSQAYAGATPEQQAWLHQQNIELEKILRQANGGAESHFNEQTGRWETWNGNLGYGTDLEYADPAHRASSQELWGMTPEQMDRYANDTDRYNNFVDTRVIRNWVDESNGFTGQYSQFANGPYALLMTPEGHGAHQMSNWVDVIGDGFNEDDYRPVLDENGNIVPQKPEMKNNQFMTDYTRDHAGFIHNGVIQPNGLNGFASVTPDRPNRMYRDHPEGTPHYTESAEHPVNPEWREAMRQGYGSASGVGGNFLYPSHAGFGNGSIQIPQELPNIPGMGGGSLSGIPTNPVLPGFQVPPNTGGGMDGITDAVPPGPGAPGNVDPGFGKGEAPYPNGDGPMIPDAPGNPGGINPGFGKPSGAYGSWVGGSAGSPGLGNYSGLINQMMDANLAAQKAELEQAYKESIGELDSAQSAADSAYSEQMRQTAGQSDLNAANWRELANAQGLNTGAVGQAALAQNNQLQSDLSTLGTAQADAMANFERQRALWKQKYMYDIQKATAENNLEKAKMLYQEAVRVDEALRQQMQWAAGMALNASKAAMSAAGQGFNGLQSLIKDRVSTGGGSVTPSVKPGRGPAPKGDDAGNPLFNPNTEPTTQDGGTKDPTLNDFGIFGGGHGFPVGIPQGEVDSMVGKNPSGVLDLGFGPISNETLKKLIDAGYVQMT